VCVKLIYSLQQYSAQKELFWGLYVVTIVWLKTKILYEANDNGVHNIAQRSVSVNICTQQNNN